MAENAAELPGTARSLIERFERKQACVSVVGLGYVGLPLAVALAEGGLKVIGLDLDSDKVQAIQRGHSYVEDIPSERLGPLVRSGALKATTEEADLMQVDGVSICVPTPLRKTGDPDLSFIMSATQKLREILHPGMVVILEFDDLSGHHAGDAAARVGIDWPARGGGLVPGLLAGTR